MVQIAVCINNFFFLGFFFFHFCFEFPVHVFFLQVFCIEAWLEKMFLKCLHFHQTLNCSRLLIVEVIERKAKQLLVVLSVWFYISFKLLVLVKSGISASYKVNLRRGSKICIEAWER